MEVFQADLELLQLLFGDGVQDVSRVWVGSRALRHLQPIFKLRVIVEELAPQSPRLLDPAGQTCGRGGGVTAGTLNRRFDPNRCPGSKIRGFLTTRCRADLWFPPEPPVQRQRTDGPPALIQAAAGLLHGVALQLGAAGRVLIAEQHVTQAEHRLYALRVLLDVPLQLLDRHADTSQRKQL